MMPHYGMEGSNLRGGPPMAQGTAAQAKSRTRLVRSSLPLSWIVGRPNVGKSTLFNAILRSRRSIVGDEPGITRDRIYGQAEYRARRFELIDTGGIIEGDDALIPSEILRQARVALEGASHVIFLVDGRSELTAADRDLA